MFDLVSRSPYPKIPKSILSMYKKLLTSSTCTVVNGPPYLSLAKSNLEGGDSPNVKALHLAGCLCFQAYNYNYKT